MNRIKVITIIAIVIGLTAAAYFYLNNSKLNTSPPSFQDPTPKQKVASAEATPINYPPMPSPITGSNLLETARKFCIANNHTECNPVLDKQKGNAASVKTGEVIVLLEKDSSGLWTAILGNVSDDDICETGTSAPARKTLCD